jgi:hypothetical protein
MIDGSIAMYKHGFNTADSPISSETTVRTKAKNLVKRLFMKNFSYNFVFYQVVLVEYV